MKFYDWLDYIDEAISSGVPALMEEALDKALFFQTQNFFSVQKDIQLSNKINQLREEIKQCKTKL